MNQVAPSLLDTARDLVPVLRGHADEADRLGRLPDPVVEALRDAGFFALQVPRALGGAGAGLRTAFDVYTELGRGCGSSAWLAMILSGGSLMASLLGGQGRAELWGTDPRAAVCSQLPSSGTARAVDGGVIVSGRWRPTSGVHQAAWAMVSVSVTDAATAGADEHVLAVLPVAAGVTEASWDVTGLRATGSDTLVFDEVFVPAHRLLSVPRMLDGGYADEHPDEPLCAATVIPALTVTLVAPLLGMSAAALECVTERPAVRPAGDGKPGRARSTGSRYAVADAASRIDTARLHLDRALRDVERGIETRAQLTPFVRARVLVDTATATQSLREAVRLLLSAAGSGGFASSHPVQRLWRDIEIGASHANVSPDTHREAYGGLLLGVTAGPTDA